MDRLITLGSQPALQPCSVFKYAIVVCGYTDWQRLRKLHGKSAPTATIIVLETMLALAVVIVTGYLTEIAHP